MRDALATGEAWPCPTVELPWLTRKAAVMTARTWTTDIIPTPNRDGTITVARGPLIDERVSYLRLLDMLDEASASATRRPAGLS